MTNQDTIIPFAIRQDIQTRLDSVESGDGVRLLMAIESGSRAWGFPSPDSDYDVRFVYVRPRDWYLQLRPGRDVIEQPIVDDIDLNGWDIRKALGLLLKSNAVISEWIESPIRYRKDDAVLGAVRQLADDVLDGRALAYHYNRLGRRAAERWLDGDGDVPVKRYFYSLRPALTLRHLRAHPGIRPPMHLQALVDAVDLSADERAAIDRLVELKRTTNEQSNGLRALNLDALIRSELERPVDQRRAGHDNARALARANDIFLEMVRQ